VSLNAKKQGTPVTTVLIRIELTKRQSADLWALTRDVEVYAGQLKKITGEIAAELQDSVHDQLEWRLVDAESAWVRRRG